MNVRSITPALTATQVTRKISNHVRKVAKAAGLNGPIHKVSTYQSRDPKSHAPVWTTTIELVSARGEQLAEELKAAGLPVWAVTDFRVLVMAPRPTGTELPEFVR